MRKSIYGIIIGLSINANITTAQDLNFNSENFKEMELTMPDGKLVKYKAYEKIYYVTNIQDEATQSLNIYVPENCKKNAPIFLKTYVGGYLASKAKQPSANDATGRALEEGYVVCIPGSRGSNSFYHKDILNKRGNPSGEFETIYIGKLPAGLLDLKAAIRYLKFNDDKIPGNSQKIITDGTSAGGAMSSLLGATGNHPDYERLLNEMGAAKASDNIWAAVCYCPITDLDHADMAYEWLYKSTNNNLRNLNSSQKKTSEALAALYPEYINSLNLKNPKTGEQITDKNYMKYLESWILKSAEKAMNQEIELGDTMGLIFYDESKVSQYILGVDMKKYVEYVSKCQKLKNPPAFDAQNINGNLPSAENKAFGLSDGITLNFTEFGVGHEVAPELKKRVKMMNPMNYITDEKAQKAPYWYIRHGSKDRDTGFQISLNLATKLMNNGYNVNYFIEWDKSHSGDYNLNELFYWLEKLK